MTGAPGVKGRERAASMMAATVIDTWSKRSMQRAKSDWGKEKEKG
jgi:hypothetical protein